MENNLLEVRLATTEADLLASQRLRYKVFVTELGGGGDMVNHAEQLECDAFDPVYDHLLLVDPAIDPSTLSHVVGVYRLLRSDRAEAFGRYYCDSEYDLAPLRALGRPMLELGRSCVHPDHRGGAAIFLLWNGLAEYVLSNGIEILFGVASFHGTDPEALEMPLSWLHHHHLAPQEMRARARVYQPMDLLPPEALDRRAAMAAMPNLIKSYLKLGGFVGEGAFVDHAFNTTDVLVMMDTAAMSTKHRSFYTRRAEA